MIQYSGLQQRLSQGIIHGKLITIVLLQLIREETERENQTTDRNDLWVLIWQITIEAIILYSNLPQEAPQNEAHSQYYSNRFNSLNDPIHLSLIVSLKRKDSLLRCVTLYTSMILGMHLSKQN